MGPQEEEKRDVDRFHTLMDHCRKGREQIGVYGENAAVLGDPGTSVRLCKYPIDSDPLGV